MATRSTIALKQKNHGSILYIYCHFDGYPEGVGQTLLDHYKDYDKVLELVKLGGLSSLRQNIHPKTEKHEFGNAEEDVTVAYHRDRGDDYILHLSQDEKELLKDLKDSWTEYYYLFKDNNWYGMPARDTKFILLTDLIKQDATGEN